MAENDELSDDCPHVTFKAQVSMRKVVKGPREGEYVMEISAMCKSCKRLLRFKDLPFKGNFALAQVDDERLTVFLPVEVIPAEQTYCPDCPD